MISRGFFSTVAELLERAYELDFSEIKDTAVSKSDLVQVLPPAGIYHCLNEKMQDVRVEITESQIILPEPVELLKF